MNFKSLKAALGKAVEQGTTYAKDLSSQVVGAKVLRDYTVGPQIASGGPACLWKIHTACCKREGAANALVSVWLLDKKPPDSMRHAASQRAWDEFLDLCRKDVANLTRLKHPGIIKQVEPFEETRNQLVLVTEAIILSLANVLNDYEGLPYSVAQQHEGLKMSELERKHGLLQVSDTLHFLHAEANLIHCALCPEAIFLSGAGAWKLASLAFCAQVEYSVGESAARTYEYTDRSPAGELLAPPLSYVAPELMAASGASAPAPLSPAADMFSLGAIAYELLAGKALMASHPSVADVQARVGGLALMDLSPIAVGMQQTVRNLLSATPSVRPSASTFQGCGYFQDDVLVRSLRFLDNLLQRDNLQKAAFLKDCVKFWPRFDARVLRYKVLPPLLAELRNETLQALVLPLVLNIIPQQEAQDFLDWTLPALLPVVSSAKGEALLVFTRNAALLASALPPEAVKKLILPLLVRAADQGDAQAQEEMVKACPMLAELVDYEDLKTDLLPRVCGLCLSTTSAGVRTTALVAMGKLLPSIEVDETKKMMAICAKVVSVDQTPGTVMCVIGLGSAVSKQWGSQVLRTSELGRLPQHCVSWDLVQEGARSALPVMTPCLAAQALTQQQYATAMRSVREILAALDAERGGGGAAGASAIGSQKSSSNSLSAMDAAPVMAASSSPRPSPRHMLGGGSPAAAKPAPPVGSDFGGFGGGAAPSPLGAPPRAKANSLADAFALAGEVSPTATVPPLPEAAAATDDLFNFHPVNRGGASQPNSSTAQQPIMGQTPMMGQEPTTGQHPGLSNHASSGGFDDFGSFTQAQPRASQQQPSFDSGSLI